MNKITDDAGRERNDAARAEKEVLRLEREMRKGQAAHSQLQELERAREKHKDLQSRMPYRFPTIVVSILASCSH